MPKQSSIYEVVYEDPAPAPNARSGGLLYTKLEEVVRDNKGAWAKIVECNSRSGANSILNRINQGKTNLPAERDCFEFTCRTDSEAKKSWLYVLYTENPPKPEAAKPAKAAKKRAPRKAAAAT